MKPKLCLIFVLLILIGGQFLYAQDIVTKGRFTNSVYVYEPTILRGQEESKAHVFLYQYLRFQARMKDVNNLTFNLDTRVVNDLEEKIDSDLSFRLNRVSLSADDLFSGFLDVEIGRLYYHPGITFGSLDGLDMVLKPIRNLQVQLFGGVESNLYYSYKIYEPDEATVYGGSLKYFNLGGTDLQLSYLEKKFKSDTQWQIAGLNLSNYILDDWKFMLQAHYDLANSRLHRFFFSTRYSLARTLQVQLRLKQQHPQIYANSYFNNEQKFGTFESVTQGGLGATYFLSGEYSITADYNLFKLKEGQGHRIIASVNNFNGSIGLVYETGDLGDQLGFLINYGYEFLPDLIGSIAIDYTRYRFEEIYDYEDQLANALRLSYSFASHWKIDLEYQLLNNKFKDTDHRFLNHIHFIW